MTVPIFKICCVFIIWCNTASQAINATEAPTTAAINGSGVVNGSITTAAPTTLNPVTNGSITTAAPTTQNPVTNGSITTAAPTTLNPVTNGSITTAAPTTLNPVTNGSITTVAPTTLNPVTNGSITTVAPTTLNPVTNGSITTVAPTTLNPVTNGSITTAAPTTLKPVTNGSITTAAPTTLNPVTNGSITTAAPTTLNPVTNGSITTAAPTTQNPVTNGSITTAAPTTLNPVTNGSITTAAPTTLNPVTNGSITTAAPTTLNPVTNGSITTAAPTTLNPVTNGSITTAAPTTLNPVTNGSITTAAPTTQNPVTNGSITTAAPTTLNPVTNGSITTAAPTTLNPVTNGSITTAAPTTLNPVTNGSITTAAPTTLNPVTNGSITTAAPTTLNPVTNGSITTAAPTTQNPVTNGSITTAAPTTLYNPVTNGSIPTTAAAAPTTQNPVTNGSMPTAAPTTQKPTAAPPTTAVVALNVVPVVAVFQLTGKIFTTNLLNTASPEFTQLQTDVTKALLFVLSSTIQSISVLQFRPGSVEVTVQFQVIKTKEDSVQTANSTLEDRVTRSGFLQTLTVNKTVYMFRIQEELCQTPEVKITNLGSSAISATLVKRSESYIIQTYVKINCSDTDTLFDWFVWKLQQQVDLSYVTSSPKKIVATGTAEWTMPKQALDYGVYMVGFRVRMSQTLISNSDMKFLSIVQSPLIAQIQGGSQVKRGFNQVITLDASPSKDPDATAGNYSGMTFTWLCKKKDETFPAGDIASIPVIQPSGLKGRGGCFDTGIGRLDGTSRTVTVNTGLMTVDTSYTIKLVISKASRTGFYEQLLEVVSGDPPQISTSCLINCGVKVNPSSRLKLTSKCISPQQTCSRPLQYQWSLKKWDQPTTSWTPVSNLAEKFDTSLDAPAAVVKANSFLAGQKYRLSVVASGSGITSGISSYDFHTNSPPHSGTCQVSPSSGIGLNTDFIFECRDWQDVDHPLKYQFYYVPAVGLTSVISYGAATATSKLPIGKRQDSYTVDIHFRVIDALSTFTEVTQTITVSVDTSLNDDQAKKVLEDSSKQVGNLLKTGDVKQATQLANAVLDTMSSSSDSVLNSTDKTKIIDDILKQTTSNVRPENLQSLTQVTSVIGRATANPDQVSQSAEDDTIKALDQMTILLAEKSQDSSAAEDSLVEASGENLALCLGNVMRSSSSKAKITYQNQIDNEKTNKSIQVAEASVRLVNKVGESLLKRKVVGERPSIVQTASLSLVLSRQRPDDLERTKLEEGGNRFGLPSKEVLGDAVQQSQFIDSQVTFTKFNPFTWDITANSIKSDVTSMVLRDHRSQDILIRDLSQDIEITISQSAPPTNTFSEASFIKPGNMRYYKYVISHPGTGLELNVTVEVQAALSILVRRGEKPTTSNNDFSSRITDLPLCESLRVLSKACRKGNDLVFLSAKLLQEKDVYYVGLYLDASTPHSRRKRSCFGHGRQKRSCVEPKDPPKPENITVIPVYDPSIDKNYSISTQKYNCMYWSGKQWTSRGCKAGPNSTTTKLHCLCNHLTSFGGSLLIEPNPIDFDHILLELKNLDESGNIAVLTTILIFLFVYLVIAIIARRADRRDVKKFGPPIALSSTSSGFQYEIVIETGVWRNSGTTSNVAIVIHGADATSDQIVLSPNMESSRLMFATGNSDKLNITLPVSLGSVEYLNVWHDNSGNSPSWNLKHIAIKDIQTGTSWFFLYQNWLSLEKGDGQINKILVPTSALEMRSFKHSFNYRTTKKFTEDHLWLSVVTKPPHSNFTRLQRATCCLVVLFSVMIVNAMFYKTDKTADPRIQVGPLKFSWRQIMVGIYSSLIVIPIGMGTVLLFKNSRRKTTERRHKGLKEKLLDCLCCCCCKSKNKVSGSNESLTASYHLDHGHSRSSVQKNDRQSASQEKNPGYSNVKNGDFDDTDQLLNEELNVDISARTVSDFSAVTNETSLSDSKSWLKTIDENGDAFEQGSSSATDTSYASDLHTTQSYTLTLSELDDNSRTENKKKKFNFSFVDSIKNIVTENVSSKDDEHGGFTLPHCFVYVSWFICIVAVLVSAAFTFMYSLQWGKEIANQWLSSILVSFTQDLFVVQPLKICIVAIFLSCFLRKGDTKLVNQTKTSPKHAVKAKKKADKSTTTKVEMNMLEETELEEAREYQIKEGKMFSFVRETAIYGLFLILLTIVCYGNRSYLGYAQTNTIMNDFNNFTKIRTGKAYWKWIGSQYVDSAYAGKWYNGAKEPNEVYIGNKFSILLGMPRIRQLRIKPDSCIVPEKMRSLISKCSDEYSSGEEDKTTLYLPGWRPLPNSHLKWANISKLCPRPWRYSTAEELSFLPSWGYHYLYSGGGYVADLGYQNSTSSYTAMPLRKNQWIDPRTRVLILEFSIFNPSSNILSTVTFYYEVLPFMFGHPFRKIETITLYGSESASYDFFLVCKLLFIFLVLFMLAREGRRAYKMRRIYFKEFWNLFEVVQIIVSFLVVVCYIVKEKKVLDAVQLVQANPYITVNFNSAIAWKYAEDVMLSIVVFIATVKILRLLRFNPHIIFFSKSLNNVRSVLISYSFILSVVIMSFAAVNKLSMGSSMTQYRTFRQAIYTQILLALGVKIDMTALKDASFVLGPLTNFLYKLLMAFFFVNFYIAVINDSYVDVKSTTDISAKEFEMSEFIIDRFKEMFIRQKDKVMGSRKNSEALTSDENQNGDGSKEDESARIKANSNCELSKTDGAIFSADDLIDIEKGKSVYDQEEHLKSQTIKIVRSESTKIEILDEIKDNIQPERYPSWMVPTNDYGILHENVEKQEEDPSPNGAHNIQHVPKTKALESSLRKMTAVKNFRRGIVTVEFSDPVVEKKWDIEEKGSIMYERTNALMKEDNAEDIEYLKNMCFLWSDLIIKKYQTTKKPPTPQIGQENEGYESDGIADSLESEVDSNEMYQCEYEEDEEEMWGAIEAMLKHTIVSLQPRIPEHLRVKNFFSSLLKPKD